jgi:hypothetical protein
MQRMSLLFAVAGLTAATTFVPTRLVAIAAPTPASGALAAYGSHEGSPVQLAKCFRICVLRQRCYSGYVRGMRRHYCHYVPTNAQGVCVRWATSCSGDY